VKLSRQQALKLSFAFTANTSYEHYLSKAVKAEGADFDASMAWRTWERMRDEALAEVFGKGLREIHDFGHCRDVA